MQYYAWNMENGDSGEIAEFMSLTLNSLRL